MMAPWLNVLDDGFNLHLRADHMAEVWLVNKPTRHGAAISIEAFDKDGALILQMFGGATRTPRAGMRWSKPCRTGSEA